MKTNYDRQVKVLAEHYGIPVDKLYSIASEGKITVSVLAHNFHVYAESLHLPNDMEEALEVLEDFENHGGVPTDDLHLVYADTLEISSTVFKRLGAGDVNPELIYKMTDLEDGRFLVFKVCNERGECVRFNESVMILQDSEIQKLETILGFPNHDAEQEVEISSEPKTKQEKREEAFERYLKKEQIDITEMKAEEAAKSIVKERDNGSGKYFTAKLWSISNKEIQSFYGKYRKKYGYKTKVGKPRGT